MSERDEARGREIAAGLFGTSPPEQDEEPKGDDPEQTEAEARTHGEFLADLLTSKTERQRTLIESLHPTPTED